MTVRNAHDREFALAAAKTSFRNLNTAWMQHWLGNAPAPVEADYNYRHGWIHLFGFGFRSDELSDGVDQPYMD